MLVAGTIIIAALITWIVLSGYAWSWVMHKAALSEAETWDFWEVRTATNSVGGLRRESGRQSSVTNKQAKQDNHSTLKPPVSPGQAAK